MTTPQHPAPPQSAPQGPPQGPPQAQAYAQPQPQGQPPHHEQGYWPGTAPAGGYVSPIPMRKATLGDALASEWTKIKSVPSTMWTLGVMVVLVVGIGILIGTIASAVDKELNASALGGGFFGVMLGSICVITLGVLTITSEYGTGMIRTTLTACPNRVRVLTAKAIVFFALTFVITLACTALVGVINTALLGDLALEATGAEWFKATVGVSLYTATLGLLALAVGTLLRHSAGAITTMLGVVLLPVVVAMFMMSDSLSDVREWLFEYSIPSQLAVIAVSDGSGDGDGMTGWDPLWIMLILAGAALAGAYASITKRDA
ncbi:ABC transporter permease subunit [Streptomyces netropsis]|uniref:ABC-type transport system involved in multi-copper enzyme maturation permease subunit n=1 Tax=Streptomyces netropsis TaxID=55404 RepID=A0A7W7L9S0_STRNE|nr:ABC transporter permease subunit [Streptomyces netropsis]MBB4885721.1 ABC-type transport system involved in multi-copper enzyme maturation permease subunit [Streptomyces netropsis]GGR36794.1 ABC transporter [Streptomyces netropsis]